MEKFHVHEDITVAETLPASFYRSQEVFEALREKIFTRNKIIIRKKYLQ